MKAFLILIALGSLSACCSTPVHYAIGVPARPHLEPLEAELQAEIPKHALKIIAENDLALKQHIVKLEHRITIHDEVLED